MTPAETNQGILCLDWRPHKKSPAVEEVDVTAGQFIQEANIYLPS